MWLFFGALALLAAVLNVICTANGKDGKVFMYISLSFTALTLCAFLQQGAAWTVQEDWSALADTVPSTAKACWILTIASVLVNGAAFIRKSK